MPGPHLTLRQTQNLVMTPQLRLAIRMLQLSNIELDAMVEDEILRNPLLEAIPPGALPADATLPEPPAPDQMPERSALAPESDIAFTSGALPDDDRAPLDMDYADFAADAGFDDESPAPFSRSRLEASAPDAWPGAELIAEAEPPLRDRLGAQLRLATGMSAQDRLIGAHLIALLDPAGRLGAEPLQIARTLGIPAARLEQVRQAMMAFDPPGLFACSLRECLQAQLTAANHYDPAMAILLDHLDLVASRDYRRLQSLCGVDAEDFAEMLAELRGLDPKPGFEPDLAGCRTIRPDVLVHRGAHGAWVLELNPDTTPRLMLNTALQTRVTLHGGKSGQAFAASHAANAGWLLRTLEQRASTLLRVSHEIIKRQNDFLERGISALRPLTLREVANALELHESTVSRVTTSKYVETPRGLFELKYFFTTAIGTMDGNETYSSEAIKHKIRSMISMEPAHQPLSDDAIVAVLRKEGMDIARRTVAKYRDALNIPSSVQRRREKAASA